ncbi:MAG: outer membrane protein assembly factor BamD [Verrucomicrobiaceae bacterium]|nr:MAG: outer membrane protein assembly factor BamD [Verrucomicrobiaceae bacterium]
MLTKTLPIFLAVVLAFGAAACSGKKTAAQEQAEKEKVWRAKQRTRAIESYKELTQKFPDSQYAAQAKERLNAMGAQPGATKTAAK